MRTFALLGIVSFLLASLSVAQASDILSSDDLGFSPDQMMTRYLDRQIHDYSSTRKEHFETLKTSKDIHDYQEKLEEKFWDAIGAEGLYNPSRSVEVTGKGEKEHFRYENIIYESQPGIFVTAILFLPKTDGPYPAVLVPCGHSSNGKAAETYQKASILLAMNGIAALCYDAIEQGERYLPLGEKGKQLSPTLHHSLLNTGAILNGTNVSMYSIREGIQGINYLQSRDDIDPDRIGVSGNSGGGTLTSYIMALDDRVKVAAPSCYLTTYPRLIETIGPQDAEQNIFGQMAVGLDHADFIHSRAPKPTLMLAATRDFFDIEGTWETYREAKRLYTRLGYSDQIDIVETDAKHGFSRQLRESMVRWMRRWFMEIDSPVNEPEITILTDDEINATPTGNVHRLARARTSFAMNQDAYRDSSGHRTRFSKLPIDEKREVVREKLRITKMDRSGMISFRQSGQNPVSIVVNPEPGIVLPLQIHYPIDPTHKVKLYLLAEGRSTLSAQRIASALEEGYTVATADVRGRGETATRENNWKGSVGEQWKDFMRAYVLGKTYVGMRTEDIQSIVRSVKQVLKARDIPQPEIEIYADGELTVPTLHALFLDDKNSIHHVTLDGGVPSWEAVVNEPLAKNVLINAVHGALKHYDLPDLMADIQSEKLSVVNPRLNVFTP